MLFLIVLTSVFGIGLCELLPHGGVYHVDASKFPHYYALAKAHLPGLQNAHDAFVAKVTVTVR